MAHVPHPSDDPFVRNLVRRKARQVVGRAGIRPGDVPDIEQDLLVAFLQRLPAFNPRRANLHAFATVVVNHRLANLLRDRRALKRDHSNTASLSAPIRTKDRSLVELVETVGEGAQDARTGRQPPTAEEASDLALSVAEAQAVLPDRLRAVAERLKMGDSITRIAADLGVPRTTVQHWIKQIRRRFERAGLEDYL
jgi:RNA polymerase sigma factor (sigma-70 family)